MRIVRGPGIKKRIKEFEELPVINVGNDGVIMNDTDAEDHAYDALRYGLLHKPLWSGRVPLRF